MGILRPQFSPATETDHKPRRYEPEHARRKREEQAADQVDPCVDDDRTPPAVAIGDGSRENGAEGSTDREHRNGDRPLGRRVPREYYLLGGVLCGAGGGGGGYQRRLGAIGGLGRFTPRQSNHTPKSTRRLYTSSRVRAPLGFGREGAGQKINAIRREGDCRHNNSQPFGCVRIFFVSF